MDIRDQFCINNFTYRRYSFPYFLDSVSQLGLKRIELSGCHPHFSIYEAEAFPVQSLADTIAQAGIEVPLIEPEQNFLPVNIAAQEEYLRKQSISQMSFYIQNAAAFGCDKVILYPGKGMMDAPAEESLRYCVESLRTLCDTAEQYSVTILLQNVSHCISGLTPNIKAVKEILDQVDKKNLALSVNTCAVVAGNETLDDYFQQFGDKIQNVQLSDSDEEDEQLVIGEGNQDFSAHIQTLYRNRYAGPITLEITMEEYADEPESYYKDSFEALNAFL